VLKLRRATVVRADGPEAGEQSLEVDLAGEFRPAVADVGLLGLSRAGDEVVVNVQARDLGLGSGGFDVVHVNLTRGLGGQGRPGAHVMKLNYTSLQHAVSPVEGQRPALPLGSPVAVGALHGQLAPLAWAMAQRAPDLRLGYVQTVGGALPGGLSRVVRQLRERGLLAGHVTAGAAFGGEQEALSTVGALAHGLSQLGWDAAVCAPGPGIVGSASFLGHGGMAALDSAHAALALGCPTLVVARASGADARARHRGISHHTQTVLELLLGPVSVALPEAVGGWSQSPAWLELEPPARFEPPVRQEPHVWRRADADLDGFAASGLPAVTMGRSLEQDPLFFATALAAGRVLADMIEAA
jgi:hypothetical protein